MTTSIDIDVVLLEKDIQAKYVEWDTERPHATRGLTTKCKYSPSDNINEYLKLDTWMESFDELKHSL